MQLHKAFMPRLGLKMNQPRLLDLWQPRFSPKSPGTKFVAIFMNRWNLRCQLCLKLQRVLSSHCCTLCSDTKSRPTILTERLLCSHPYSWLPGHFGDGIIYDTMQRYVKWPHLVSNVNMRVNDCKDCSCSRGRMMQMQHLKLSPVSSLLLYIAKNILGLLRETNHSNWFIMVMTDRYCKLERTLLTKRMSARSVTFIFFLIERCHTRHSPLR